MSRKPATPAEQDAYRTAYFQARALGQSRDQARQAAYIAVHDLRSSIRRNKSTTRQMTGIGVVNAARDASGRPACYTVEEWNYGCTPGQFARARKSSV